MEVSSVKSRSVNKLNKSTFFDVSVSGKTYASELLC